MKVTVWAVISCIPERGEPPVWPAIFATEAEAEAHAEQELRDEWEAVGEWDEERSVMADYPGNWREANERLKAKFSDGSWGEYRLITQEIDVALPAPIAAALSNALGAIGELDSQIGQMEGMFDDEDGQIAEARDEGADTCNEIRAVFAHFNSGTPLPVPEIYITMDGGLIEAVLSTGTLVGASYTVIDFDIEGTSDDTKFVDGEEACIDSGTIGTFSATITDNDD